jgi:hypothetical protein
LADTPAKAREQVFVEGVRPDWLGWIVCLQIDLQIKMGLEQRRSRLHDGEWQLNELAAMPIVLPMPLALVGYVLVTFERI